MEGGFQHGMVLLEKYRVESELGRGGMGVVLLVTHLHLGESLAMKVLSPDVGGSADGYARFLREVQSAVRLRGEHVARVGDVGVLPGGAPYMVMEYLRGEDLASELARRGALPAGEVVDHVLQVCEALAEAHALGIVHRDIKPGNLFLTRRPDGSPLVKVLDFGISKAPIGGPEVLTRTGAVMGTPGYMSPEQMKGSKGVDLRADIWALGIVLYECLNGRRPFDAETYSATVLRAATDPPPTMDPWLPRALQAVILRCLEKEQAARFPSVAALASALVPFARDRRAAEIIAERTSAMLRRRGASVAPTAQLVKPPDSTTLRRSVGTVRPRQTWLNVVGVAALVLTTLATLSIAGQTAQRGEHDGVPAVEISRVPPLESPIVKEAVGPRPADMDAEAKVGACSELQANQRWPELRACADELAALDARDRSVQATADEFRDRAIHEADYALVVRKLTAAIAEGNVREAQQLLTSIEPDSVYFARASKAFHVAEARVVDDNRRTALVLAATNDCAGIRRLKTLVDVSGTPAVVGAVAAVAAKCMDRAQP